MYRRMLFIGLGGSGGKTLRFMKSGLNEWLERHGWDEGVPSGFQFVHIDTPTEPDGKDVGDSSLITTEEYLGLVGKGISFEGVANSLDSGPTPSSGSRWMEGRASKLDGFNSRRCRSVPRCR